MFVRLIHDVPMATDCSFLLLYSIPYLDGHCIPYEHLSCFRFGTMHSKTPMNTPVHVFCCTSTQIPVRYALGVKLLGHGVYYLPF